MAAPKPRPTDDTDVDRPLLPDTELSREERLALLRGHSGVVVRRRGTRPVQPFVPSVSVVEGSMTLEDLFRLLGRDDEVDVAGSGAAVADQP